MRLIVLKPPASTRRTASSSSAVRRVSRGNVEIVCARYRLPLFDRWGPFVTRVVERLR